MSSATENPHSPPCNPWSPWSPWKRKGSWSATGILTFVLSLGVALIAIYTAGFGAFSPVYHRSFALLVSVIIVALVVSLTAQHKPRSTFVRVLFWGVDGLIIGSIAWSVAMFISVDEALSSGLYQLNIQQKIGALGGILAVIELTRRVWGFPLAVFGLLTLFYCYFGLYLPGIFFHTGFDTEEIARGIWYGYNGVFGIASSVVIGLVWVFIVFGVVLQRTGAGEALLRITLHFTRRFRGGPAHAAVIASGIFGTMSGSSVANVVGTGTFTIPMIIRRGFSRHFAAGIEATASCGGQLVPPIMGAAAFLMAELTGIPYMTIIVAATLPALFYYASLFIAVTIEAAKTGVAPVSPDTIPVPSRRDILPSLTFLGPLAAIIFVLASGRSAAMAGFWGITIALVLGFLNREMRRDPKKIIETLHEAGVSCAKLMVAVGVVGVIIGAMNMTGLGLRFAGLIESYGDGTLWLSLVLTMFGAIVLGMGMPTVAAYLIIVLVMGPAIVKLGPSILAVHMFVLYYGVISSITPPVALASYAAAAVAGSNPILTSVTAVRLGAFKFLIPFVFAFNPELLLVEGFETVSLAWLLLRMILAAWLITTGLSGFEIRTLPPWERIVRVVAGVTAVVGVAEIVVVPATLIGMSVIFRHRLAYRLRPSQMAVEPNDREKHQSLGTQPASAD